MHSVRHDTKQIRVEDAFLKRYPHRVAVWWYGPITKNAKAGSVPLAVVFFRRLDDAGNPTDWLQRDVALTSLGLLRIGSVWRHGVCEGSIERLTETFDLGFFDGGWSCTSPADAMEHGLANPIPDSEYPLRFRRDHNNLLDFKLAGGKNLLIPCVEFYARCYGRSAEVKRVLATYSWPEAEPRLFKPIDEQVQPDTWPVKLARRMRNDDVVFLAHVKYDSYARHAAKSIYSQAEAAFKAGGRTDSRAFLKAVPWFQGSARLKVAGVPLHDGRTFLALRILGASQPQGNTVIRDRENPGGSSGADGPDSPELEGTGRPVKRLRKLPAIIDLTGDDEPDQGSMSVDIEEDGFELLGEPRAVIDRKTAVERGLVRRASGGDGIRSVSTGEPRGSGKGIGYGSIHAPIVLESQGALREVWNAARHIGTAHPDAVRSVGWFTFSDGIAHDHEPVLIPLTPDRDNTGKVASTWVYHDVAAQTPRGVLVVAMELADAIVYLLEIQRRTSADNGTGEESEEPFKGLAVVVQREQDPRRWLHPILRGIQTEKGVVQRLIGRCPGTAYAYKHVASVREIGVPYEASVLNALAKVGLTMGAPPRQRTAPRGVS